MDESELARLPHCMNADSPSMMHLRVAWGVIGATLVLVAFIVYIALDGPPEWSIVDIVVFIIAASSLIAMFAWIGLTLYLNYFMLDEVEAIVDPIMHSVRKSHSQERFITGSLEIGRYSMSATWVWANRRFFPDYDFRDLPRELRVPLKAQFVYLMLGNLMLVVGSVMMIVFDIDL
jgi:hypothetical protein